MPDAEKNIKEATGAAKAGRSIGLMPVSTRGALGPQSGAFTNKFKKLRDAVLAHAKAEEQEASPLLDQATTVEERQQLGDRYQKAKDTAPDAPPPSRSRHSAGKKLLGPIAALFGRAPDAAQRV